MATQYRQGDVFLERVDAVPDGCRKVPREKRRVVLAHGEATGHHHSLATGTLLEEPETQERFLVLEADGRLTHQEHDPIALPAGTYRVVRQREYSPEAIRHVQD